MYEKVIALDIKRKADQAIEDLAAGKPLVEVARENLEIIKGQRPEPAEPIKKPAQEASPAPLAQEKTKSEHEERPSEDKKTVTLEEKEVVSPAQAVDKPRKQLAIKGKEDDDRAMGGDRAYSFKRFYSIQVGALENLDNAEKMVNNLKRLGHNAFCRHETTKGKGKWYRVYIERYGSRKEAEKEARVLKNLDLISAYFIKAIEETTQTDPPEGEHDKKVCYLHVNSFKEKPNAEKKVKELEKHGYKAFLLAEEISGENWFRVYIGEYDNEKGARKIGLELKKRGIISYFKPIAIDKNALFSHEKKGHSD
ncbi:MAG: SPOR domain-containing protein [Deltaproteobacteria bacterium]|nr:SPOR domain-containing protein [Deltaproteobacteria bacterium]